MDIALRFCELNSIFKKIRKCLSKPFIISLDQHIQIVYIKVLHHIQITVVVSYNIKREAHILAGDGYFFFQDNSLKHRDDVFNLSVQIEHNLVFVDLLGFYLCQVVEVL